MDGLRVSEQGMRNCARAAGRLRDAARRTDEDGRATNSRDARTGRRSAGQADERPRAWKKAELWHAAFHRLYNGIACRSSGGRPMTTGGAVAAPLLHLRRTTTYCTTPAR